MAISPLAGHLVTVHRRTPNIIDSGALDAAPGSIAPDRSTVVDAMVEITVSGAGGGGTLTINGDVSGAPDTEVLTFTGPGTQSSVKRFDAGTITSIDRAGWAGGQTFTALSVGSDGSREHMSYVVVAGWRMRFDRGRGGWPNTLPGRTVVEKTRFYMDYTTVWEPKIGDVFVDDKTGSEWKIKKPELLYRRALIPHHWEIEIDEEIGSANN